MRTEKASEFYMVRKSLQSEDVIIVFSAARVRPGSFMLSNVLKDSDYNQIYLNCPDNGWYLDGVPGLGNSLFSLAESLQGIIAGLKGSSGRVIAIGSSMGAYAAYVTGSLIDSDYVFATGGEYILNLEGGFSKSHIGGRSPDISLPELARHSRCVYHLGYGAESPVDAYCLSRVSVASASRIVGFGLENWGHSVPRYIEKRWGYASIVKAIFEGDNRPIPDEVGEMHKEIDLCDCIWKAHHQSTFTDAQLSRIDNILSLYIETSVDRRWKARAMLAKSILEFKTGGKDYLSLAASAVESMKRNPFCHNHLARMHVSNGNHAEAEKVAATSLSLQRQDDIDTDPMTPILLSRILKRQEKFISAINVLSEALSQEWRPAYQEELIRALEDARQAVQDKKPNKLK